MNEHSTLNLTELLPKDVAWYIFFVCLLSDLSIPNPFPPPPGLNSGPHTCKAIVSLPLSPLLWFYYFVWCQKSNLRSSHTDRISQAFLKEWRRRVWNMTEALPSPELSKLLPLTSQPNSCSPLKARCACSWDRAHWQARCDLGVWVQ